MEFIKYMNSQINFNPRINFGKKTQTAKHEKTEEKATNIRADEITYTN